MKIISVANRKGGVGKTVISANLGHELARRGFVTLLIDLDPQCDLTKYCLTEPVDSGDVFKLLRKQCSIESCCLEVSDNLFLIPGSKDLNHFVFQGSKTVLRRQLSAGEYLSDVDFVILDHPPALSNPSIAGFSASDEALVVSDTEAFGVDNLTDLLEDLADIKRSTNPNLHVLGIVVNKVDSRRKLAKKTLKALRENFRDVVFSNCVSYNTAFPLAIHKKVSLRELPWYSQALRQLSRVTDELLQRMEESKQ
ncbi:MAG: ParA family protein [Negativicutes bacterium]|nr:ParA family protein [Negativicutes bacterium]